MVGSIVVSRATSMGMAIAGEVICGFTYGAQPLLYAVASEILPRQYRPAAQGGINAALGAGGLFGLLGGSALMKTYDEGFRIYWYIVAGLMALSSLTLSILFNPVPRPLQISLTTREKLARLDWVAYFFLTTGIVLFVIALSWAENPYPWRSVQVVVPLVIGGLLLVALIIHQVWFRTDGLIHHGLFKMNRNFALALFILFVDGLSFFAANQYYSFEVGILYETDPFRIGLRYSIAFFGSIVGSLAVAVYASIRKTVRFPIVLSFLMFTLFYGMSHILIL